MANVSLYRIIDKILFLILLILYPIKKIFIKKNKNTKKVLIIRLWGLGDGVCVLPIIKKLASIGYETHVLTTKELQILFKNQTFIKKTIFLNHKNPFTIFSLIKTLLKEKYEIVIDTEIFMNLSTILGLWAFPKTYIGFSHKLRAKFHNKTSQYIENHHFVENFSSLLLPLQIKFLPQKLVPLRYSKQAQEKVEKILLPFKTKKLIAMHIGSGGTAKGRRWRAENFKNLANIISQNHPNTQIIFTGLTAEKQILNSIKKTLSAKPLDLTTKLSQEEFIYLLTNLKLFITNDTGPMHISAAMGTKTIGLFGMNNPRKVGAWPLNNNINIYKNPKNNPIINNKYSIYPPDKYSTINLISVGEVYTQVKKPLKNVK